MEKVLLRILAKMREFVEIARDTKFKLSAHPGAGNPASAKLFENIGLDSFNLSVTSRWI
ncbi:hypothetical protein MBCUT_14130 [Methanobrevibacter cuticularis]|uniref:Uncharacterized protein n=1 Tax=Methanobrevibacter cuticularis TaxID=47311 RepID=A0A166DGL5_9EURY|nr:hypothetical protein MBCUT_14130 [Methanobrevibacter cuticularis]